MITKGYKQTELGVIPEDWQVHKLGDVGEVKMCKRIFNHQTSKKGQIPFFKIGTFGKEPDAYIDVKLYQEFRRKYSFPKEGYLLISASGTIGRTVEYCGEDAYYQDSNIIWIDNNEKLITNKYLKYTLEVIKYNTEGSTIKRLYNSILKSSKFVIPPTLKEQEAIAKVLTDTDNLIQGLENVIAKKKAIKKGAMQQLLTPPNKGGKRLPGFSGEWVEKLVSETIEVSRGGSPRPIQDYITNLSEGVNWIKIGDTSKKSKYISSSKEKIIPEGANYSRKVFEGDFLLSNSMSFGRPYIMKIDGCIHDGWLVLQNYQENFDKEFLYYTLTSEHVFNQYLTKASGSGVLNLNKELVKTIILNSPPTKEEQEAIATILSDIDKEIEALEVKKEKYIQLKKGLAQELLTGKTRLV